MLELLLINLFASSNPQQFDNPLKVYTMTTARFIVFSEVKGSHRFMIRMHKMMDDSSSTDQITSTGQDGEHLNNIPVQKKSVMLKVK